MLQIDVFVDLFMVVEVLLWVCVEMVVEYFVSVIGYGVLIMVDGEVVFEGAQNDWAPDWLYKLVSGIKSFWSLVVVVVIEDGIFSGFDEKVVEIFEDWGIIDVCKQIIVWQLLNFISGIDFELGIEIFQVAETDVFVLALLKDNVNDLGICWVYSGMSYLVLGVLFECKLVVCDIIFEVYFCLWIFELLGMKFEDWCCDVKGCLFMLIGVCFLLQEWVVYGEMV